jgi:hypothetical protein
MNLRCSNVSGFSLTTVITICPKLFSASVGDDELRDEVAARNVVGVSDDVIA